MTPLLLGLLAALVLGAGIQAAWRGYQGRQVSKSHHRALDTLGHMTASQTENDASALPGAAIGQRHVRIVPADSPPPSNAPSPVAGGWRSRRASGAAPFRPPAPARLAAPAVIEEEIQPPAPEESVRLVYRPKLPAEQASPVPGSPVLPPATSAPPRPDVPARPVGATNSPPRTPTPPPPSSLRSDRDHLDRDHLDESLDRERPATAGPFESQSSPSVAYFDSLDPGLAEPAPSSEAELEHPRRHHRRRSTGSNGVLTAVAGLVVLVVAGSAAAAITLRGGPATKSATAVPKTSLSKAASAAPHRHPRPATSTTTTTVTTLPVSLVSSSPQAAVYRLSGAAQISINASGPCWVNIRQGNQTGPVIFSGTLGPGSTKSVSGPAWVRLGNPPAVSISVNGTALSPPATAAGVPYNLEFE